MKLYNFDLSSASYRVRIGLNLKRITYENINIDLLKNGGEQNELEYSQLNPQSLVPSLELTDGMFITQSLSILEYLDEAVPEYPFLPEAALERSKIRSFALSIACDIHPLNNLRVLKYLKRTLNTDKEDLKNWYNHWVEKVFHALEKELEKSSDGDFCFGNKPSLADICLIPQVRNASRFELDLTPFPLISQINDNCMKLDAFLKAR